MYRWDGAAWVQQPKLTAADTSAYDRFGESVAISGDLLVIGAPFNDNSGDNSGAAYVFELASH